MKRNILMIISVIVPLFLYSIDYNRYDFSEIFKFELGEENGKLKVVESAPTEYSKGPYSFAFDSEGNLYVADTWSQRIVIFDNNFSYVREIKTSLVHSFRQLFIDESGNIFGKHVPHVIRGIDKNGNEIVNLNFYKMRSLLDFDVKKIKDLIYTGESLFIILKDDSMKILDKIENDPVKNMRNIKDFSEDNVDQESMTRSSIDKQDRIEVKNKAIYKNGKMITHEFKKFLKSKEKEKSEKTIKASMYSTDKASKKKRVNTSIDPDVFLRPGALNVYLGEDSFGFTYWRSSGAVIVFDTENTLVDAFVYDSKMSKTYPVVHPSGDIYVMDHDNEYVYLRKISSVWKPEEE